MTEEDDEPPEFDQEADRLRERLTAAPVVELRGVVDASGAGGAKSGDADDWTLRVELEGWRIGDGPFHTRPLVLRRSVTEAELRSYMVRLAADAVVALKARVVDAASNDAQGLLEEVVGPTDADDELNTYAETLKKHVLHQDPILGTFTRDRRSGHFDGEFAWNGKTVAVSVSGKDPTTIVAALATARELAKDSAAWDRRIQDFAVQELLTLKNDVWLEEGEAELTSDEFKSRMALDAVTVHADGSFDFWYDDGGLFWGHCIYVAGNLKEGPTDADIPG
ncbi:MAG: DUF2262 domain-containing protein [Planctomycetia bacterium]